MYSRKVHRTPGSIDGLVLHYRKCPRIIYVNPCLQFRLYRYFCSLSNDVCYVSRSILCDVVRLPCSNLELTRTINSIVNYVSLGGLNYRFGHSLEVRYGLEHLLFSWLPLMLPMVGLKFGTFRKELRHIRSMSYLDDDDFSVMCEGHIWLVKRLLQYY